jgi:hypothetical protein
VPESNRQSHHTFARHVAPFAPLALALLMNGVPQNRGPAPTTPDEQIATEAGFAQSCANPHFPTDAPGPMGSTSCGISGNGGAETWQNEAKNNFCAPDPPKPITIPEMVQLQTTVQQNQTIPFGNPRQHPLTSSAGPAKDRTALVALGEGSQVVLQGYVSVARQEGAESVNCGSNVPNEPDYHDIHISIVQNASDSECSGAVVEMTPHHRPTEWTPTNVEAVAKAHLLVRVTGQLMFDSSHTPCVNGSAVKGDPSRVSLWEIHPIYKFEVCSGGTCSSGSGWVPLEAWTKT